MARADPGVRLRARMRSCPTSFTRSRATRASWACRTWAFCASGSRISSPPRARRYRVHEDVDIVATMAFQFLAILVARKPGVAAGGIDLDGFLRQLDAVIGEWLRHASEPPDGPTTTRRRRPAALEPAAGSTRGRIAALATEVYVEHLRADGLAAERLRTIFRGLSRAVAELALLPVGPVVDTYVAAALELGRELGKRVEGRVDVADVAVEEPILEVVKVAVLHVLRNAVDHGVEAPADRGAKGVATVRVTARAVGTSVELRVDDDGRGIDLVAVRAKAIERGLLSAETAAGEAELLDLVFRGGLSTRDVATSVSGRGVGLDAVRAAIERVGGTIAVTTRAGQGTRFVARLPRALDRVDVQRFTSGSATVAVPVDCRFVAVEVAAPPTALELLDVRAPAADARHVALDLRRGDGSLVLAAGATPTRASALRVCPTDPHDPLEIVEIEGAEVLLLRPDVIARLRSSRGQPGSPARPSVRAPPAGVRRRGT